MGSSIITVFGSSYLGNAPLTVLSGMQRFGTAAIPTHSIGLALLKSDWHLAVSLILRPRPGEHPDVLAARRAWLDDGDLDRALELLPRRVVAERCILESYKKQHGETRNALGALSTVCAVTITFARWLTRNAVSDRSRGI
jgi:hypothetical protein